MLVQHLGTTWSAFFARLVRDGDPLFQHRSEGADDMPAHVRSALTAARPPERRELA